VIQLGIRLKRDSLGCVTKTGKGDKSAGSVVNVLLSISNGLLELAYKLFKKYKYLKSICYLRFNLLSIKRVMAT
jgi:hypothetical protein